MGLRDWVSEKAAVQLPVETLHRQLQWGSETGSRRRADLMPRLADALAASMGLRDWVSEKARMAG